MYNKKKIQEILCGEINYKKKHRTLKVPTNLQDEWNAFCDMMEDYLSKLIPNDMTNKEKELLSSRKYKSGHSYKLLNWTQQ